ncbi:MAG: Gldg family protein [Clostridia bacterium]|nr:Gldg family protein [Clostridia bacterium]
MTQKPTSRKQMHPANAWMILTALVLIAIFLLNLLIQMLPASITIFDLTSQKITEISDITREYVSQMKNDVVLYRICVTGNEDQALVQLMEHYDELSEHISVVAVDPAVYPRFTSAYTDKDLSDNSIIVSSDKRSKALDFNDLLLYNIYAISEDGSSYVLQSQMTYADFLIFYETYADVFTTGDYTYQTLFIGEDAITSALDYVTSDVLPKVYLTTGHGESAFPESLYNYLSLDNIDYGSYSSLTDPVPEDADCILLYAPTQDFTEEETKRLRDYLLSGGNLMLFTSYATLELPNLLALMSEFGMDASDRLVLEGDSEHYQGSGYFLYPNTDGARNHFSIASYNLLAPYSHSISMGESEHTMTYTPLFTTTAKARLEDVEASENEESANDGENASVDFEGEDASEDTTGSYDVGALVTLAGENAGHLCWFGTPQILDSDFNSASGGGNYTYFLAILENLCEKNYSLVIESKVLDEDVLVLSDFQVGFWGIVLIVVIPLSVLGIGLVVHMRRKYR